jgi:transcription-repair coupling factor (superfamily II helicase)
MGVPARRHTERRATEALPGSEVTLRLGDAVIHLDHGMGILRGLETVETADVTSETIKLDYARKEALLAPIDEIGRIWRYGTEVSGIRLDGLDGKDGRRAALRSKSNWRRPPVRWSNWRG